MKDLLVPILQYVVPAILVFLSGGFLVPWGNWIIEKKRAVRSARILLIKETKETVNALIELRGTQRQAFSRTDAYARIREYLTPSLRSSLDEMRFTDVVCVTVGRDQFLTKILTELAILEKRWGLL